MDERAALVIFLLCTACGASHATTATTPASVPDAPSREPVASACSPSPLSVDELAPEGTLPDDEGPVEIGRIEPLTGVSGGVSVIAAASEGATQCTLSLGEELLFGHVVESAPLLRVGPPPARYVGVVHASMPATTWSGETAREIDLLLVLDARFARVAVVPLTISDDHGEGDVVRLERTAYVRVAGRELALATSEDEPMPLADAARSDPALRASLASLGQSDGVVLSAWRAQCESEGAPSADPDTCRARLWRGPGDPFAGDLAMWRFPPD